MDQSKTQRNRPTHHVTASTSRRHAHSPPQPSPPDALPYPTTRPSILHWPRSKNVKKMFQNSLFQTGKASCTPRERTLNATFCCSLDWRKYTTYGSRSLRITRHRTHKSVKEAEEEKEVEELFLKIHLKNKNTRVLFYELSFRELKTASPKPTTTRQ